jgi:hypothetical protein
VALAHDQPDNGLRVRELDPAAAGDKICTASRGLENGGDEIRTASRGLENGSDKICTASRGLENGSDEICTAFRGLENGGADFRNGLRRLVCASVGKFLPFRLAISHFLE